jgi:ParB family transcriptional regulator, chromosome partitioning protein
MKESASLLPIQVTTVATMLIRPNPLNPRKKFDVSGIERFGQLLARNGKIDPLRVFQMEDHYVLISGERRWRAAVSAGIQEVPVMIEPEPKDATAYLKDQLMENEQRESIGLSYVADTCQELKKLNNWTNAQLAREIGMSESDICRVLTIRSSLTPELRVHVESGALKASVAYEIAKIRAPPKQIELAERVMKEGLTRAELLDVIRSEQLRLGPKSKPKPIRLMRSFSPEAGFEPIKQALAALLNDVQRCEKNNLPLSYLNELWAQKS